MELFKRNAKGEPIGWTITDLGKDAFRVDYGAVGGHNHTEIITKTHSKIDEIAARIKAKRKEGYKELSELKDGGPDYLDNVISLINYLKTYLPKNNTTSDGFVLPMLAKVLKDGKPFEKGYMAGQYKINGVRCIIGAQANGMDMFKPIRLRYWSREGTEWTDKLAWMDDVILPFLKSDLIDMMLEEGACLDGELYIPGFTVNAINSAVKNVDSIHHRLLQYWCYDLLVENMAYNYRDRFLTDNINKIKQRFDNSMSHVSNKNKFVLLPYTIVCTYDDAVSYRNRFIRLGFEGLILRNPDAEYQFGKRNQSMFKFKMIDDGKFEIVDIVPEGEKRENLGKLILKNDINDELFECTLNASQQYQELILKHKNVYIGKYAVVEFRERSGVKQVPFHAKATLIKVN